MAKEPDDLGSRLANVIGIRAKRIGVGLAPSGTRYSPEWKACCAEILSAFRDALAEKLGGPVGWSRVRNAMMTDFDVREGNKIMTPDERFRRQDLEHWLEGGIEIGDDKFRFVDHFIQEGLLDDATEISAAAGKVIAYRQAAQYRAMETVYLGAPHRAEPCRG